MLLGLLAGCSGLSGSNGKGYVTGQMRILNPADRPAAVDFDGVDLDGKPINFGAYQGQVVVINIWETECVECRKEAPLLAGLANELDDVVFMGINIRDASPVIGRGFVDEFNLPYPSYFDPDGESLLAFAGQVSARAIPTTIVLDRDARPAAVIYGEIPTAETLRSMIEEVADA